jgi:hypothetical protein
MRTLLIACLGVAALAVPRPADAWGFEAHKYIMARALALLPAEIRPYFEQHRDAVVERVIDPDLWRNAGFEAESPHHFVDMDAYGAYPFKDLPRDYDAAVQKYGKDFVTKNGTLPWRTEEMYKKLVEAFRQKAGYAHDNIKYFAAWVSHYVGDAHVPLHSTLNHDGQLTGQRGIHSRFESEMFERYRDRLRVTPGPIVAVKSPRDFMFESLLASFQSVEPLLAADREAVKGRDVYDDAYFAALFGRMQPVLEQRLAASITDTASLITAAWIEAGRPAVPVEVKRTPRKVSR